MLDISYEWLNDTWRIGSRSRITSLVKRISFQKLGLNRRLFISDPTCWGKHFKVIYRIHLYMKYLVYSQDILGIMHSLLYILLLAWAVNARAYRKISLKLLIELIVQCQSWYKLSFNSYNWCFSEALSISQSVFELYALS